MSIWQDLQLLGNPEADNAYEGAVEAWAHYLTCVTNEGKTRAISSYRKYVAKLSDLLNYHSDSIHFLEMEKIIHEEAKDLARIWWTEDGFNC